MKNKLDKIIDETIGLNQPHASISEYYSGYNQALQDLRTKAPQLAQKIVDMVVEEIERCPELKCYFGSESKYLDKQEFINLLK